MAMSKEVDLAYAQRPVPCDTCEEDEVPGTYYCIQCKKTLCEDCKKSHRKFTKGHKVILRTQVGEIDITVVSCSEHEEQASFHCEKCDTSVCGKCITGKHQGHKMVDLNVVIEGKRKVLQCNIDMIQQNILPKLVRQRKEMKTKKEESEKEIKKMADDINAENKFLHEKLDRLHHQRMDVLNTYKEDLLSRFDVKGTDIEKEIQFYEKRVSEYKDVLRNRSFADLTKLAERSESLPELRSMLDNSVLPSFIPADVQGIVEDLEKLQPFPHRFIVRGLKQITQKIVSKFKCPLQGHPRICITQEGDVWLGANDSKKLVMVDIKGHVLKKREIPTETYSLAVLSCGDIIMSPESNEYVYRLVSNGGEENVLDPSSSKFFGVSVNAAQEILICTSDGRVLKTKCRNKYIKTVYEASGHFSSVHAVERSDGNIYITNRAIPAVVILSMDGRCLSTIKETVEGEVLQTPMGLVVDKIGNILCADRANNCVYIIDQNEQMRRLIGKDIKEPQWLAVDNEGNLWITQKSGTIAVVKYLS